MEHKGESIVEKQVDAFVSSSIGGRPTSCIGINHSARSASEAGPAKPKDSDTDQDKDPKPKHKKMHSYTLKFKLDVLAFLDEDKNIKQIKNKLEFAAKTFKITKGMVSKWKQKHQQLLKVSSEVKKGWHCENWS